MSFDAEQATQLFEQALLQWDWELDETQRKRFIIYADMLADWNANRLNLTRLTSPEQIAIHHFLDSVAPFRFISLKRNATILDIGTGPGFPGLALKIFRPDLKVTLMEATAKKLTFCKAVSEASGLTDVDFLHSRAESPSTIRSYSAHFDLVTARAVASLSELLTLSEPYVVRNGVFIAWKGSRAAEECVLAEPVASRLRMTIENQSMVLPLDPEQRERAYIVCRRSSR